MHIGAAQFLGADDFAGRGLDQRRSGEKDRALAPDDDAFVRHRRDIGAARGARPHDDRDLRHAQGRHLRLVIKDPPEMLAVGEHLVLRREIRAARIDEVEAGQAVVARDLLGAQVLLDGHREIGAALDRRVVGDDDAFAPPDAPDPGDDPGRRHPAVIHPIGGERRKFEKRRPRIEQQPHPLARQQFAAPLVPRARRRVAALGDRRRFLAQIRDRRPHRPIIGAERIGAAVEQGGENRHRIRTLSPFRGGQAEMDRGAPASILSLRLRPRIDTVPPYPRRPIALDRNDAPCRPPLRPRRPTPFAILVLTAAQHVAVITAIGVIFPKLVLAHANLNPEQNDAVLGLSMLALGIATLLQTQRLGSIGSGFLAPVVFTAAYLAPPSAPLSRAGCRSSSA